MQYPLRSRRSAIVPFIVHCIARHRGPWYRHTVCDRARFHGRGHKGEHLSHVGVDCFGGICVREVQVARPLVSRWNATDLLVVGRAVFDSLGMRSQHQKSPLTTPTKESGQMMSEMAIYANSLTPPRPAKKIDSGAFG